MGFEPSSAPRSPCSALEKTQARVVSFDDSVTSLREMLSDLHEKEEDYSKAAQVCTLGSIIACVTFQIIPLQSVSD